MLATVVDRVSKPINVIEIDWTKKQYFQGAPCPVTQYGALTATESDLCTPFGKSHFIGTETSLEWKVCMEGAIRSGERIAGEIIAKLKHEKKNIP